MTAETTSDGLALEDWLFPAGTFAVPAVAFVGAHYGAGTSTWAGLLGGADAGQSMPETGSVIALCRSTPAGTAAVKTLIGRHGVARFQAVLVIADAPAKMLPQSAREVKVLSGALPVVVVPWIPALRGVESAAAVADDVQRPVARIREKLRAVSH